MGVGEQGRDEVKETELAEFVIHWLQSQHWDVYQEVQFNHYSAIADIVAVRNGIMWIIETKLSMTMDVLYQASRWLAHYRSIAVPKSVNRNGSRRTQHYIVARDYYRVGILEVDLKYDMDRVYEAIRPPLIRNNHLTVRKYSNQLCEEHKTYARAGQVSGHRWTPYRSTMEAVREMVRDNPGCTIKDIFDKHGKMHYASPESFKGNLLKALEDFERDWCRIDKTSKPFRLYIREE